MSKKKEFTISYHKRYDDNGTVYNQTINITNDTFKRLKDIRQAEIVLKNTFIKDDLYKGYYLNQPLKKIGNIVFLNLTQRDFFNKYLKLDLKDRNTCFCLID